MRIVFFTHPAFLNSQSMPRFANMLVEGFRSRGHVVESWTAKPIFYSKKIPGQLRKWFGYADQYLVFPIAAKRMVRNADENTLFVFTDHALGPWVPLVAHRKHVVHCHDFLAQRSANGEIVENVTGFFGKKYQAFIREGYRTGKNFISVSHRTRADLHEFLNTRPTVSEVVYNGVSAEFKPLEIAKCRTAVGCYVNRDLQGGYILHVGGNQWYKNRPGVIEIYDAWRKIYSVNIPLILIGAEANEKLKNRFEKSPYKQDIFLLSGTDDAFVKQAYCGAKVFLFPSLAEGFGWPVVEAMASGVPVITTGEDPMAEVGGNAALYIPRLQLNSLSEWANTSAIVLNQIMSLSDKEREAIIKLGFENARRFDQQNSITEIESIYQRIIDSYR